MAVSCPSTPPVVLCLGGMDPSGGAGLLRDALSLAELGCQPMAVSLAETLQNGLACLRIEAPGLDPVQRLEALFVCRLGGIVGNLVRFTRIQQRKSPLKCIYLAVLLLHQEQSC